MGIRFAQPLAVLGVWSSIALAQIPPTTTPVRTGASASVSASSLSSSPSISSASASSPSATASAPPPASSSSAGRSAPSASSSARHSLTTKPLPPPPKEEQQYEPPRIYLEPGAFRFSLGVWGVYGPKSATKSTLSIPWGLSAGFQLDSSTYLGINDMGIGRVDVPNGKRIAFSWAPVIEKQFWFNKRNPDHAYIYFGVDIQHRWGAKIEGKSGYAALGGIGHRSFYKCTYAKRGCGAFFVELKGFAAATDMLIQPAIIPKSALVGTFSIGFNGYRF